MGPTSAEVIGAAIVIYALARPTIRINILTACFMVCISSMRIPWERESSCATNYIGSVNALPGELGCRAGTINGNN